MTSRRTFLKSAGLLTAAAALFDPAKIFARNGMGFSGAEGRSLSGRGEKKIVLEWCPYEAKMKHVFTISHSSRTSTPIVLTRITYDGYTGYGEAAMEGNQPHTKLDERLLFLCRPFSFSH